MVGNCRDPGLGGLIADQRRMHSVTGLSVISEAYAGAVIRLSQRIKGPWRLPLGLKNRLICFEYIFTD